MKKSKKKMNKYQEIIELYKKYNLEKELKKLMGIKEK